MTAKTSATVLKTGPGGSLPEAAVRTLAQAAKSGKIIAFPTDTVYGLGSTALIKAAAARIYEIKGRPASKPLPLLVQSLEAAKRWVQCTPTAEDLARRFWPGALTLVLRPTTEGRELVLGENDTLAIRMPNHPAIRKILETTHIPWASTSANLSGSPAFKDGIDVVRQFEGLVDFIVDSGQVPGVESTVVDATQTPARVLRQGALWIN